MMNIKEFLSEWTNDSPTLLVHTSGSTGKPKPLWVEKRRMEVSARITCDFLGLKEGDTALLCLPLDYIAGKMMVVRSLVRGLRLVSVEPSGHPLAQPLSSDIDFAAMVPMQVWNSLRVPEQRRRLMQVRHLIIGGGAIDEDLAAELHAFPNAVWSTYGMTETLSHVALRRLSGPDASDWYTPFAGVSLSLTAGDCLVVDAPAVCPAPLVTNDIAQLASDGRFRILGRRDNTICSGGVKIQAEEAERLLRPHFDAPFLITKRVDPQYGEAVVLLTASQASDESLLAVCRRVLPRFWCPRHVVHIERIPLTATGKPARREAEHLAAGV
jgi:O-succinylbenzoic acid--CoA ligase